MKMALHIFWFRRDLRLTDNAGLFHALKAGKPVLPIFIFDKNILNQLEDKKDRRVAFIHDAVEKIQKQLIHLNASLEVYYGSPDEVFKQLVQKYNIEKVFTNHDYEPYAKVRDNEISSFLALHNIAFQTCKDQVIFEKDEVVKDDGKPYTVFTPYSKKWKLALNSFYLSSYNCKKYYHNFLKQEKKEIPSLESMGFHTIDLAFPSAQIQEQIISNYSKTRNFPANTIGTSRLGIHLRFGTISIRRIASIANQMNETFLNELIWRDFYQMILWHFPHVGNDKAFKREYDTIEWRNNETEFASWCNGTTGYPIVDAGMRELNETGFMHNRVRMIVASFLTKHLLIDWRWGEAYFAEKLLDFDLASNNGGWQWAAGSGCDAAPYFRIFNPYLQTIKFDESLEYIKRWVPELNEFTYPKPIVDHDFARKRALEVYGKALKKTLD